MPVFKCDNGKWKIGEKGECKFDSKEAAEKAFRWWMEHNAKLSEKVTEEKPPKQLIDGDLVLNRNDIETFDENDKLINVTPNAVWDIEITEKDYEKSGMNKKLRGKN